MLIVPEAPPGLVLLVAPGAEPAPGADGEAGVCANATLLTRAAAATIIIVLYMRFLQLMLHGAKRHRAAAVPA